MHPKIEKLETLFSQRHTNPAALTVFYDELWVAADMLPRNEMRQMADHILASCNANIPPDKGDLARATLASGFVAYHEGAFDISLSNLLKARELFSEIKDEQGMYASIAMEGCNYRTMGELELALKCLLEAYQNLQRTGGFKHFFAFCLHQLAEIYSETRQLDESLRFHKLCEDFAGAPDTENQTILSRTLNGIGVVYRLQKKYSMSLEYLLRALKLTEEINNPSAKARVLTDLGIYYFEMGDYLQATNYQQQALDIRRSMHIENGVVTNMMLLAEISAKLDRNDEAVGLLSKALAIAENIRVKQKIYQIHSMLSEVYQHNGNLVRCIFHYKAFHQAKEEVLHEDSEKKVKNLHLIFQAEQTIKENCIIKAQKVEIENKNRQLQDTIDELTITKVSRKAKALTLFIGITLIIAQEPIFSFFLTRIGENNYMSAIIAKVIIIMSLKPIDIAIENYLLKRIVLKKKARLAII